LHYDETHQKQRDIIGKVNDAQKSIPLDLKGSAIEMWIAKMDSKNSEQLEISEASLSRVLTKTAC
jgi:hypothetical protein